MAILSPSASTTTNLTNVVEDFTVDPKSLDFTGNQEETEWVFPNASQNLGYYTDIPELKRAIDSLAIWTVGKGFETDAETQIELEHITGWGEDTFTSIMEGMIIMKKIVGDAFAEIIKEEDKLINLKPISPERVKIVLDGTGRIKRYEVRNNKGKFIRFKIEEIFHICNNRIADQIHGTSTIDCCKWVIDARNEAMEDDKKIKHRELAMGYLQLDTDDPAKIQEITNAYADAVKKGEVLVLPKDVAEIKDTGVNPKDRLAWIQYLEGFFYQAVGIPRVIATSQDYTEAASKVGYLTFEPIYTNEQTLLEQDLWNQLTIKIKFNRPVSLGGTLQADEAKNTGQTGFQPSETEATIGRNE